jgi:beta-RFAP synthase
VKKSFTIDSPARLHLGFMELNDNNSRVFGSIGLAITNFKLKQSIQFSKDFDVICDEKNIKLRIEEIIELFSKSYKIKKCRLTVSDFIPLHKGLGSGTQVSLCTGFLISSFNNLNLSIENISKFLRRGQRSGVGVETFKSGGFIIDTGKLKGSISPPQKLIDIKWPKDWQIILITSTNVSGFHGKKESSEFAKLTNVSSKFAKENCFNLLMKIIPGLLENDFNAFANGIQKIQENMSEIFYGNKNNYSNQSISKIFKFVREKKYIGFGQSSWGPTGFVFCKNREQREEIFNMIENFIELKKIEGINLLKVRGRNFGNKILKVNK